MTNSPQLQQGITRQQAASELLDRRAARKHLLDFTTYTFKQYKPDKAHRLIADTLTQVVLGKIDRLMIFAPPQSGKSELVSVRLPVFWLANRPDDPVIVTSYGASLALDKSKQARDVVNSAEFKALFPGIELRRESQARDHWKLEKVEREGGIEKRYPLKGSLLAAGVDGPVTGHGGMLGIIDDPFENWKSAQSETQRNNVWQWWQGTFRTRIWEGGAIILIMTRWHEDDLAGRLLQDQPGRWRVIRLPMIAETQTERDENNKFLGLPLGESDPIGRKAGEVLVPTRFSPAYVEEIKREVGSRVWSAEYQGVPRPPEGNLVKRDWFEIVERSPRKAKRVRYWDKAGSENEGDFTVGLLMAEKRPDYYIEDVVRGQWTVFERQKIMLMVALMDTIKYGKIKFSIDGKDVKITRPEVIQELFSDPDFDLETDLPQYSIEDPGVSIWIEQEGGSGGKDSVLMDIALLAGFSVRRNSPTGDKIVRAEPWISQAEAGNIKLVRGAWNFAYMNEITAVPFSSHDDQWDATSGAFSRLSKPRAAKISVVS